LRAQITIRAMAAEEVNARQTVPAWRGWGLGRLAQG
jgi:hypothetical protein